MSRGRASRKVKDIQLISIANDRMNLFFYGDSRCVEQRNVNRFSDKSTYTL